MAAALGVLRQMQLQAQQTQVAVAAVRVAVVRTFKPQVVLVLS